MTGAPLVESGLRFLQRANPLLGVFRRSLARNERADEAELREYAERCLRGLIRTAAARSPYYRETFERTGVDPRSILSLEDLTLLPTLARSDLVEEPERFLTVPRALVRTAHTSGTSGEPATCFRTAGSIIFELAALERQLRWHGLTPGLRSLVLREDFAPQSGYVLCRPRGGRRLQISPRALTPARRRELMERVARFRPEMAEGWPSRIAEFAQLLLDCGLKLRLAAVRTSSEAILPEQRELFRSAFGGVLIDVYGQAERVAMGGTCEQGSFHLFTDYGIVEFLPAEGTTDYFELVATPLHNRGFPLFRYRTGDFVRLRGDAMCPCGRPFPVVGAIEGRLESHVAAADGRKIPLASAVLDDLVGVREAQLIQHRPGVFEVRVVPGRSFDLAGADRQIRANVEEVIGSGQTTVVTVVPAIDRSNGGKRSAVVVREEGGDKRDRSTAERG